MITENNKSCAIIGAGVSGLGAAIRMRNKGYNVTVFEANSFPGGKLSTESKDGYRFDMAINVLLCHVGHRGGHCAKLDSARVFGQFER